MLAKHEEDIEKGLAEPLKQTQSPQVKKRITTKKPPKAIVKGFSHANGLDLAYTSESRMYLSPNGTLYIAGTSRLQDIGDDIKLVIPGQGIGATFKYHEVLEFLNTHKNVKRIVGHSLGGAIAEAIGKQYHLPYTIYNAPVASWEPGKGHHRVFGDWVSLMDMGAQTSWPQSWNVHDYHDEASRMDDLES